MPASIYEITTPNSYDYEITEGGKKKGDLRLKPSTILWAEKGAHKYYSANLDEVVDFIKSLNRRVSK